MYKANFGENNPSQIRFNNENEYYQALGYLAQNNDTTSLNWENNELQGAWGSEGRIHFYVNTPSIPGFFSFTAGTGNIRHRTNCNEFIKNIVTNHSFVMGDTQDIVAIRNTIPANYISDFNHGLTL